MKLTPEEKEICKEYGLRVNGKVRCPECPLVIDARYCLCKANASKAEWWEYKNDIRWREIKSKER